MRERIDQETILRVCEQAKLTLSSEERERLWRDIDQLMDYFSKIEEIDTAHVSPLFSVQDQSNVFRLDEAQDYLKRTEELLVNAPKKKGDFLVVPKVVS